jgi:hypothetical protein
MISSVPRLLFSLFREADPLRTQHIFWYNSNNHNAICAVLLFVWGILWGSASLKKEKYFLFFTDTATTGWNPVSTLSGYLPGSEIA